MVGYPAASDGWGSLVVGRAAASGWWGLGILQLVVGGAGYPGGWGLCMLQGVGWVPTAVACY